jgi:hypothetical protein
VVAVGNLDNVWIPEAAEASVEKLKDAFGRHFGVKWDEALNALDRSVAYHAANTAYFSVRDLRRMEHLMLDQLTAETGNHKPLNIIAS